jgi:hypothetical protein
MRGRQDEVITLHAPFEHAPFEIVLRGFNRQQVLDRIGSLEARLATLEAHNAMLTTERDAALRQGADLAKVLEHLRREAEQAANRVERLQRSSLGGAGVRLQRMLQVAEDEITALQLSTEQETTSLRERTRAEADRLLRETTERCEQMAAESAQRCSAAEAESAARCSAAEAESAARCSAAEAESAARCRQAEQDSERRRRTAQQQAEREIARQEAEWRARIQETHTRGVAGLHLLLRLAGERLTKQVAAAEADIRRLTKLRTDVAGRLSSAHSVLVEAIDQAHQHAASEQGE